MGYLIKLQNVLGRLRDYNSKRFEFRKYQDFTNLTKTFCSFCVFSPNQISFPPITLFLPYIPVFARAFLFSK